MLEVTTRKTSKNEAYELYNDLIKGDIAALTKAKSRGKDKRENILRIPQNLELVLLEFICIMTVRLNQNQNQNLNKVLQKEIN